MEERAGRVDDADPECLALALLNTASSTARLHGGLLLVRQIALLGMQSAEQREAARPGAYDNHVVVRPRVELRRRGARLAVCGHLNKISPRLRRSNEMAE